MNFLSLILILSILGSEFKEGENQIINGFDVLQQDFKYHVSIFTNWSYACVGGIIDTTHIITAAHCVDKYQIDEIIILAGVADLRDTAGVLRIVKKMFIPLEFNNNRRSNDIAVLKLHEGLVFGDTIGAIPLSSTPVPDNETVCWLTGLDKGRLDVDEWKLTWTPLRLIPNTVCECMVQSRLPPRVFCAGDVREITRPTSGDSGSVLVCNGMAVGILSARIEDKPFSPNLFCNIYEHIDFIRTTIMLIN